MNTSTWSSESLLIILNRFCRFLGTQVGLIDCNLLLWWYWPEAHGYVWDALSIIILASVTICDLAYPFVLAYVRTTERTLPGGTIVAGPEVDADKKRA